MEFEPAVVELVAVAHVDERARARSRGRAMLGTRAFVKRAEFLRDRAPQAPGRSMPERAVEQREAPGRVPRLPWYDFRERERVPVFARRIRRAAVVARGALVAELRFDASIFPKDRASSGEDARRAEQRRGRALLGVAAALQPFSRGSAALSFQTFEGVARRAVVPGQEEALPAVPERAAEAEVAVGHVPALRRDGRLDREAAPERVHRDVVVFVERRACERRTNPNSPRERRDRGVRRVVLFCALAVSDLRAGRI